MRQRKGLCFGCDLFKGIWHHKSVDDVVSDSDLGLVIRSLEDLDEEKTLVHSAMGLNIVGDASLEKELPHKNRAQNAQTVDLKKFSNDRDAYGMKATTRRDMSGPLQSPVLFGLSYVNFRNFLFGAVLLSCLLNPAQATRLMKPNQVLPDKCFKLIEDHGGDCPSIDHYDFQLRHNELNSACCADYPGKMAHCQMDYDTTGVQYSQIACMEPVPVRPGFSGRIVHYDSDTPMFRLTRFNDTHRPQAERMSYEVTYPYGTIEKSKCTGLGQERLCIGVADNLCTCQEGFEPIGRSCEAGFSADAPCYCQEMTCPVGSHPKRSADQGFGDVDCSEFDPSSLNFSCEADPPSATTANLPLENTTPSPSSTLSPDVTTKLDEDKTDINLEFQWLHILWAIFVFAGACAMIFVTVWCLLVRKETKSEDRMRLQESQIGGRGSDVELGLENPAQD